MSNRILKMNLCTTTYFWKRWTVFGLYSVKCWIGVSGTFVFMSQTGRPAVGWNGVRLVQRSMWTGPCSCCCCIRPHEWPATCHRDTSPRLATSVPGDDDEPKQAQQPLINLSRFGMLFFFKFPHLHDCAVAAMPHDALNSALWTLLEPGPQPLEVHWWGVSYSNAAVWHEEVDRLLLTSQSCWDMKTKIWATFFQRSVFFSCYCYCFVLIVSIKLFGKYEKVSCYIFNDS